VRTDRRADVGALAIGVQVALVGVFFGALNIRLFTDLTELQLGGASSGAGDSNPNLARRVLGFYSSEQSASTGFELVSSRR
jgi:hypothetical protein